MSCTLCMYLPICSLAATPQSTPRPSYDLLSPFGNINPNHKSSSATAIYHGPIPNQKRN